MMKEAMKKLNLELKEQKQLSTKMSFRAWIKTKEYADLQSEMPDREPDDLWVNMGTVVSTRNCTAEEFFDHLVSVHLDPFVHYEVFNRNFKNFPTYEELLKMEVAR
ncbi:hypothetical protein AGMMS49944_03620 [Spirochaetia bacterium]|nr:hypothetical protein AGMMS49944_03620 [Spirochaetia bacterium]